MCLTLIRNATSLFIRIVKTLARFGTHSVGRTQSLQRIFLIDSSVQTPAKSVSEPMITISFIMR